MQGNVGKHTKLTGEGHISMFPWHYYEIVQGTFAWTATTSQIYYSIFQNAAGVQNDELTYKLCLDAGTYTLTVLGMKDVDMGIATYSIDGSSVGTIDWYNGSAQYNRIQSVTGISVTSPGLKTLSVKSSTKNGSATKYVINMTTISLYRTA